MMVMMKDAQLTEVTNVAQEQENGAHGRTEEDESSWSDCHLDRERNANNPIKAKEVINRETVGRGGGGFYTHVRTARTVRVVPTWWSNVNAAVSKVSGKWGNALQPLPPPAQCSSRAQGGAVGFNTGKG